MCTRAMIEPWSKMEDLCPLALRDSTTACMRLGTAKSSAAVGEAFEIRVNRRLQHELRTMRDVRGRA